MDKSGRLALMESQQRAATDLYRRLSLLVGDLSARPEEAGRVLDAVERTLKLDLARAAGLDSIDLELIRLIADGWSNLEIAEQVHLSVHTIKDRVSRIVSKLGARSRAGVGARAAEEGLLLGR